MSSDGGRKRFLFIAPPFTAHVNPMASISAELLARGQTVSWVTYESMLTLLPDGIEFYAVPEDETFTHLQDMARDHSTRFLAEGFMFFFRDIVLPLRQAMSQTVDAAIEAFGPDCLVVDQHALAGVLAARKLDIPWVTSAPSAQLLTRALDEFRGARDWLVSILAQAQVEAGLDPVEWPDRSPHLVLLYTTRALASGDVEAQPHFRFVGPAMAHREETAPFPWQDLNQQPHLFVSLGTLFPNRGGRFLGTLSEALADQPVQVIVSTPPELIPAPPANFIVQRWAPLMDLWPKIDAVLCHAGTIVNEALAHGIPTVVAPIAMEQSIYAQQVVDAGAGVRVRFGRAGAQELRDAVFQVLREPSYRQAAARIRDSFKAAGGTSAAADAVMALTQGEVQV